MAPRAVAKPGAKKKPGPNAHKLPDPIREGEILKDISKRQWRIGKSIGVGGFGEIYAASDNIEKAVNTADAPYVIKIEPHSNGPLFVEMNFYIRVAKAELIDEWIKQHKLKFLGMPRFIGSGSHEYKGEKYRFMVMQRFGTDVQKLFEANQKRLPVNTVLNLALKIIDVLEFIHDKQYVHADIKGSNLLLGHGKGMENQVWLVDFGLACRYTNSGVHKEYKPDQRKAHNGTIEFTSRDAHIGANSRRGDFEILGYNLLQWLCSRLPWEDKLTDPEYVAEQKNKYMANIPLLIQACFPAKNAPGFIGRFLEMVAKLKFEEKPNYDQFRALCRQGLKEAGYPDDGKLVFKHSESPSKKKKSNSGAALPTIVFNDETENKDSRKQKIKTASKRDPCSPKVTNKTSRKTSNVSPDASSSDTSVEPIRRSPARKNRTGSVNSSSSSFRPSVPKLDDSLSNPTPAMLAIMARKKMREESTPVAPAKKKQATDDSASCSPERHEGGIILTPAMEEVIRVRELRKSMEVSGHFFTPSGSPTDGEGDSGTPNEGRFVFSARASSRRRVGLIDGADFEDSSASTEEEQPVRRKTRAASRRTPIILDSTASSIESVASPVTLPTPEGARRIIRRRKYEEVCVQSAGTQTTPSLFQLSVNHRTPYALRSGHGSRSKPTPPVVDLAVSPDIFQNH